MHRGGEVGRQRGEEMREREKGSVPLLWHRHKGIPSARLSPPTCLLSPRLAPRHTRVHTHSCLHGQSRNGLTRKKGQRVGDAETLRERRETGWGLWRSTFRVWHWRAWRTRGRGKGVKTVVSGRYSSGFASSQDMIITFMTLWSMNTVYLPLTFFFFKPLVFHRGAIQQFLQPVDQDGTFTQSRSKSLPAVQMYCVVGTGILPRYEVCHCGPAPLQRSDEYSAIEWDGFIPRCLTHLLI